MIGQKPQRKIYCRIDRPHCFGRLRKSPCQNKNPYHDKDILIGSTFGKTSDALGQRQSVGKGHSYHRCDNESNSNGYSIKIIDPYRRKQINA